jgi:CDP-glucose 4,6-dehydratase
MDLKLKNFYKNKRVLITGVTGFKGAWLAYWLKLLGAKVTGIGYSPNNNKKLFNQLNLKKDIKLKNIDIRNYDQLKNFIKKIKPQLIFHLAAQPIISKSYVSPKYTYEVNSVGTLNLVDLINKFRFVKSTIFVTSDKCYESNNSTKGFIETDKLGGVDPYSGSKACAEIIVRTYRKSFFKETKQGIATARAGNVVGGGDWSKDRLIPDAVRNLKKNKKIIIRNPNFNRPWQHVLEPLNGYLILAYKLYKNPKKFSGAWNFGTERNTITSVKEIIKFIIYYWGKGEIKIFKNKKFYEQTNLQLNINKSKKLLNWKPKLKITDCIFLTTDWYKKVLFKKLNAKEITKKQILDFMRIK